MKKSIDHQPLQNIVEKADSSKVEALVKQVNELFTNISEIEDTSANEKLIREIQFLIDAQKDIWQLQESIICRISALTHQALSDVPKFTGEEKNPETYYKQNWSPFGKEGLNILYADLLKSYDKKLFHRLFNKYYNENKPLSDLIPTVSDVRRSEKNQIPPMILQYIETIVNRRRAQQAKARKKARTRG
jgi:hypothetical protein